MKPASPPDPPAPPASEAESEVNPFYAEAERGIFAFSLNGQILRRDPFDVERNWQKALRRHGIHDIEQLCQQYDEFNTDADRARRDRNDPQELAAYAATPEYRRRIERMDAASEKIAVAFREALGFKPVDPEDGSGVPVATALRIFDRWCEFRVGLKKSTGGSPATSTPSAGPPADSAAAAAVPAPAATA